MPAINVARTDTFEVQRQKINEIGANLFQISQGGSDLSTGNLKLGDGTRPSPSLSFINESSLGIFRPTVGSIGFVSAEKNLFDITTDGQINYKNLVVQKRVLTTAGTEILSTGSGYDPGNYQDIATVGGTGDGATLDIEVTEFVGTITNVGEDYIGGTYTGVPVSGGSGTGARAVVVIGSVEGDITDEGYGYKPGLYTAVPLSGGSGDNNITADINISGDTLIEGDITNAGSGYADNTYEDVSLLNSPTSTFTVRVISNPGTPPPNNIYEINSLNQPSLTFVKGNTYAFDISDSSLIGHPFAFGDSFGTQLSPPYYYQTTVGVRGNPGAVLYITVSPDAPTQTIQYLCQIHPNMGSTISVQSGTVGNYGRNIEATVQVVSGSVDVVSITNPGTGYKVGDTLIARGGAFGLGGGGFLYTINDISYTGVIGSVFISDQGSNYLNGDVLTAADSDLGNGGGSGFQYTITSDPGIVESINFDIKGIGYEEGDLLTLPAAITNINVSLGGSVTNVSATLSTSSNSFTVANSTGIVGGMTVTSALVNPGQVAQGTVVQGVVGNTIFLSAVPTVAGAATLSFNTDNDPDVISVSSAVASAVTSGWSVTQTSGAGQLDSDTEVSSVNTIENTITLSKDAVRAGGATLRFNPPWGTPSVPFQFTIDSVGAIETVVINNGGNGYSKNDLLSVSPTDLIQPVEYIVTNQSYQELTFVETVAASFINVGNTLEFASGLITNTGVVVAKTIDGGNLVSVLVETLGVSSGDEITKIGNPTVLTIDTANDRSKWYINGSLTPNLTLYEGSTYFFDTSDSSNEGHQFALSIFSGGSRNQVTGINTTLSVTSTVITVSDTTGILAGMAVSSTGTGVVALDTTVVSVDSSTQITLSDTPAVSGDAVLRFYGAEFTDGVSRPGGGLLLKVTNNTPSTLYYYCSVNGDEHIGEGDGASITIDPNNPKTFGSGFELIVSSVAEQDVITLDVLQGKVIAQQLEAEDGVIEDLTVNTLLSTKTVNVQQKVITTEVESLSTLTLDSPNLKITGNVAVGNNIFTVNVQNGNTITSGFVRANGGINVNNVLTITNNEIVTAGTSDILMIPALNRVAKVNTSTAFVIPKGTSGQRPISPIAQDGAIRFNTTTNQYEGYSQTNAQWSSLGGVRDLDGNTTILAEQTVGANDNTLWFINDNINTLKVSPSYLEFVNVKKLRSPNLAAPEYTNWVAQAPVELGDYVKYRNNIYLVSSVSNPGGTNLLAVTGSEPTHVTGDATNGDVILTYHISAVAAITFEEVSEVRIDPLGFTSLVVNNELRLSNNKISSIASDIVIQPTGSQKVEIAAASSLVIPVGDNNSKGNPKQGSIRYNTSDNQFEGYNGAQWSGLGGVIDIDQDTKIIPELGPGTDDDILFFYNGGDNTLQLSATGLSFESIDTISSVDEELNLNAELLTISNFGLSIDHTVSDTTFLLSTKEKFDIGLSSGLQTDHLLRLTNTGNVLFNLGFGTGTPNNLTILNSNLTTFDLNDVKISTSRLTLSRSAITSGNTTVYNTITESSGKVLVTAWNTTTNAKEIAEFNVIDNGVDLFYTEINNMKTGGNIFNTSFDIDGTGNARLTLTLSSTLGLNDNIEITFVKTVSKR